MAEDDLDQLGRELGRHRRAAAARTPADLDHASHHLAYPRVVQEMRGGVPELVPEAERDVDGRPLLQPIPLRQ